ncbi:MAG: DUF4831 family protein [Muribaculaceae bacterium]|nr:DUF4831 family protein [Muribaculaceae bacterium]
MRFIASIILTALLGTGMASAQQTKLLSGDKNNDYGVVYSLPRTELVIDAECVVTKRVPGPYREYAKRYLGAEAPIKEHSSSVEPGDVKMWVRGIAAVPKYLFQMKVGAIASVNVSTDGMLLAINSEVELESEPLPEEPVNQPAPDMNEYLRYVDADYLASLSSAKRAQLLAQTIMEIRESRLSLSRGTAETMPADGRQLELMLQSLEQQENAMMRAFFGCEYTVRQVHRYTCIPDSAMIAQGDKALLFRLSDISGFCQSDDYSGEPVYLSFKSVQTPEVPLDIKGEPKPMPKNAVIYCIPGTAQVSLSYKGDMIGSPAQFNFSQTGITYGLDPKLFTDKKSPSMATFDAATGALLDIAEIAK